MCIYILYILYTCGYVYIYIVHYINTLYTYACICICVYTHVCMYKHLHICTCVHTYMYMHTYTHVYTHMHVYMCVYTRIYTYIMSLRVKTYSKCKGPEVGRSLMILSNRKQVGVARTGFLNSRTTDIWAK